MIVVVPTVHRFSKISAGLLQFGSASQTGCGRCTRTQHGVDHAVVAVEHPRPQHGHGHERHECRQDVEGAIDRMPAYLDVEQQRHHEGGEQLGRHVEQHHIDRIGQRLTHLVVLRAA